jgi:hypothetical protein
MDKGLESQLVLGVIGLAQLAHQPGPDHDNIPNLVAADYVNRHGAAFGTLNRIRVRR